VAWYGWLVWLIFAAMLGYERKRWVDQGRPPRRRVAGSDLLRYFWLLVFWPVTGCLLAAISVLHLTGSSDQLATANALFDSVCGLARRIDEADVGASFRVPSQRSAPTAPTGPGPPAPGWWEASDGRWYPPSSRT